MESSRFALVKTGFCVHVLFAIFAVIIDRFFVATANAGPYVHVGGTVIVTLVLSVILYGFVAVASGIKSWKFYVLILPFFLFSCLDSVKVVDYELLRTDWVFPSYVHTGDALLESVWAQSGEFLDTTLLLVVHYTILYNYQNGKSWRSLTLFTSTVFQTMIFVWIPICATTTAPLSLLTRFWYPFIPYLIYIQISVYLEPKAFTFKNPQKKDGGRGPWDLVTIVFMVLTVLIIVAKFLVSIGMTAAPLTLIKNADPMILFETVPGGVPAGTTHSWLNMFVVVPMMTLCIHQMVTGGKKAEFLWDLGIIQAAFLVMSQFFTIVGSVNDEVPSKLRGNLLDPVFLGVNILPMVASALYLEYLSRDRVQRGSNSGRNKTK